MPRCLAKRFESRGNPAPTVLPEYALERENPGAPKPPAVQIVHWWHTCQET